MDQATVSVRSELSRIGSALNNIQQVQTAVASTVGQVQTQQVEMDNRLIALAAQFASYVEADRRAKQLQLAETRVVKVRQQLETEYGHYGEVRRRATGILQALDAGLVTHETIQTTTEDVMMAAPRYWLAPALVALAGWSRDDRPLAEKALSESITRDGDKTSLFFGLVLRRFDRRAAAARWIGEFFARQDPTALNREFVVLLDAVATGAFGPEAKGTVSTNVEAWIEDLTARAGFVEEQHRRWKTALVALTPGIGDSEYHLLRSNSPNWQQLASSLAAVRRHEPVLNHFRGVFEGELTVPHSIQQHIDDLLDSLVAKFDAEELPLRQQEAHLQAIIDCDGDTDRAQAQFDSTQQALVETVDFLALLTNAAMNPEEAGASRGTQRMAVAMSRDWIVDAHEQLVAATRQAAPTSVSVQLGTWTGTLQDGMEEEALHSHLESHVDNQTAEAAKAVKLTPAAIAAGIAGLVFLIGGAAGGSAVAAVFGLLLGAYLAVQYFGLDGKRKAIRERGEQEKSQARETLRGCLTEFSDYREEWIRRDADAALVTETLTAISPSEFAMSRNDDARMVV
jgi:hypothetical protein